MPPLDFSWAKPDEKDEIRDYIAASYGPDSIQAQAGRAEWLFFDNPLGLHVSLCRHEEKIVGCCGNLPEKVQLKGQEILAGFGVDMMVAPGFRRMGMGRRFVEMRLERFPLSLSMGQSSGMKSLYWDLGAKDLGPLQWGTYRRRPPFRGKPRELAKGWLTWVTGINRTQPPRPLRSEPTTISGFIQALAAVGGREDPKWLDWRFNRTVYGDYQAILLNLDVTCCGGAIVRTSPANQTIVHLAVPDEHRHAALVALTGSSPFPSTDILFAGNGWGKKVREAGFLVRPYGARLVGISKDPAIHRELSEGSLEMTCSTSDADLIRFPAPTPGS